MNSAVTDPIIDIEIAAEDEVQVLGGGKSWRFANGKIVRGPETEPRSGTYAEERARIVGLLERVGIYNGIGKDDNNPYSQIEADVMTRDGLVHVKANLTDPESPGDLKPSVSAIKFAWGLLQFKKGEQLMIEASRSAEPVTLKNGKKGGYVTYVNFARVANKIVKIAGKEQMKPVATPIYSPRRAQDAVRVELVDQWLELEPQIKKHDAFADRPASMSDDDEGNAMTHLSALCKEVEAKGWPTPEQAVGEWLGMAATFFGTDPKAKLTDYSDDEWGEVRQALSGATKMPGALEAVAEKLKGGAKGNAGAFA